MRKFLLLMACFLVAGTSSSWAQGKERVAKTTANASQVYLEAGGNGIFYSLNYDGRFGQYENGLGFRLGVGAAGSAGNGYVAVPAQVNYLVGNGGQYLELGAGATYISSSIDLFDDNQRSSTVVANTTIGFRKQPFGKKGITWRVAFTPFISSAGFLPWAGASIGYRF